MPAEAGIQRLRAGREAWVPAFAGTSGARCSFVIGRWRMRPARLILRKVGTRFAMGITGLGYIGVRAKDLADWGSYGTNFLGLQRIDKSRSTLAFRMDDRKQRLVVEADGGQGIAFFGWEVADAAALDALAARL